MNAIILAAGLGTRLRPLTNDRPKCLVPVLGTPMIEQQLRFLTEAGITDITVVSGYCADRLEYLKTRYGVKIVHNEYYNEYNNIYSLYLVREDFGDTYILEGDVYMPSNCILPDISRSTYFAASKEHYEWEWGLTVDSDHRVTEIRPQNGSGYILSGISYWNRGDATKIRARVEELVKSGDFSSLFWDDAVLQLQDELEIYCQPTQIYEIDTVPELRALETLLLQES